MNPMVIEPNSGLVFVVPISMVDRYFWSCVTWTAISHWMSWPMSQRAMHEYLAEWES